jgi:hypothetical protein
MQLKLLLLLYQLLWLHLLLLLWLHLPFSFLFSPSFFSPRTHGNAASLLFRRRLVP